MDTAAPQWPQQGIGVVKSVEKKAAGRPAKEHALNCPRCSSTNTKFCYYNNYSLSQPRYFCKACRRYWTEGGCLRNVPVGGGSRKNRRPYAPSPSPTPAPTLTSIDKSVIPSHGGQDLNLAYNHHLHRTSSNNNIGMSEYIALPFDPQNPNFPNSHPLPVMEFFNSSSGFPVVHDFKAGLGFPAEGYYGNLHDDRANNCNGNGNNNNSSRSVGFPFGEMKQQDQQIEQGDQAGGFWNGMLAGGSSSW